MITTPHAPSQTDAFRKVLSRNVMLPLLLGLTSAAVFVALLLYLVSTMRLVDHSNRVIGAAQEISKLVVDSETGMRGYLLTGRRNFLDPYNHAIARTPLELDAIRQSTSDNRQHSERLTRVSQLYKQWHEYSERVITLKQSNQDFTTYVSAEIGKNLMDAIRAELGAVIDGEEAQRDARSRRSSDMVTWSVACIVLLMLIVGGGLAYNGRRQLLALSLVYRDALQQQQQQADVLGEQAWIKTGQTELASRLLGQQSIAVLASNALQQLVQYLGAQVGAFYIQRDDNRFHLAAGYALAPEHARATFATGETLAGQAVRDGRLALLEQLPDDYLPVSSALGERVPRQILMLPVIGDSGEALAVAELGFVEPVSARALEFTRLAAANLASALKSASYREQLRTALEEAQQLNEELQTQQEELKTANEELEEQSNALRETQGRLENQQAELERNNEQLSEQSERLQQQKDFLNERNQALRNAQHQLEERAGELQRASQYKSEFLANMSHELRTPLNSALIFAKLLADNPQGNLSDEQVRFASMIHDAGSDLLNLINDILDLSKVEAGMLDVHAEPVALAQVERHMHALFQQLALDKGIAFTTRLDPHAPHALHTDQRRLEQVLKNLLSNAFKFTHEGEVALFISADEHGIAFAVRDTGIGIAPEQQQVIFEAFRQADGTTNRKYAGTGLGLSISRDLARLLGGNIQVDSAPNVGSTFTLHLPLALDEPQADIPPPPPPAATAAPARESLPIEHYADDRLALPEQGRVMLVIEDDERFASILYQLAHERGFACLVALTAQEGVQLAGLHRPDAILLDLKLPDQSGMAVLEQLKEDPLTRHIPTHVISSLDRGDAALYMGAVGYLAKPAARDELLAVFERLEARLSQKIKHLLLVEDDAMQRESITHLIADPDIEITGVAYAEEALQLLRERVFDCMVIDLSLPDMHGLQLLERMASEFSAF
ncbi:MAG TPA: CHASE3 domain-containing protein, partial [Chitinolyticbacter sp.]|nr:CHASE3 domain-containing protein [Chitinolyticbacter sp.]